MTARAALETLAVGALGAGLAIIIAAPVLLLWAR